MIIYVVHDKIPTLKQPGTCWYRSAITATRWPGERFPRYGHHSTWWLQIEHFMSLWYHLLYIAICILKSSTLMNIWWSDHTTSMINGSHGHICSSNLICASRSKTGPLLDWHVTTYEQVVQNIFGKFWISYVIPAGERCCRNWPSFTARSELWILNNDFWPRLVCSFPKCIWPGHPFHI